MMEPTPDDQRISQILTGHHQSMDRDRDLWQRMRAAADNRLWTGGHPRTWTFMSARDGGMPDPFPVRVQVNLLRPWLQRGVGALYMRAPRVTAKPPDVQSATAKGRVDTETAQVVQAVCESWLQRQNVKDLVEQTMENALMYPGAALKIGLDTSIQGSPLDQVWLDVLPRWEALWDELSHNADRMRYAGHLRWEPVEKARKMLDQELDGEPVYAIGDYLVDGGAAVTVAETQYRDEGYVQVLDWYDLTVGTFTQCLVRPAAKAPQVVRFKDPEPIAWKWATGRPLVPIEPVILANSPGFRYMPVSLAAPVYEQGAEKSLILTTVVNAFRRDSARVMLFLKESGVSTEVQRKILEAIDLEFVGVEPEEGQTLASLFLPLVLPDISRTLKEAYAWLTEAGAEQSSMSPVGQGGGGGMQYAAATLVQSLASSDAATLTAPAARMNTVLGRLCEAMLAILGNNRKGLKVLIGGQWKKLSPEQLRLRWQITVEDSLAAQGLNQARRAELIQAAPVYVTAVATASSQDPGVTPEVKVANERLVDTIADTYDLPASLRWDAVRQSKPDIKSATPDADAMLGGPAAPPASQGAPPAPAEPPLEDPGAAAAPMDLDPEALAQLLAQLPPEQIAAELANLNGGT